MSWGKNEITIDSFILYKDRRVRIIILHENLTIKNTRCVTIPAGKEEEVPQVNYIKPTKGTYTLSIL